MISTVIELVLLGIVVALGAAIVIAHRKQADAWTVLTGFSALLLSWLTFIRRKDDKP